MEKREDVWPANSEPNDEQAFLTEPALDEWHILMLSPAADVTNGQFSNPHSGWSACSPQPRQLEQIPRADCTASAPQVGGAWFSGAL